ncbi:MAG: hypothetical protein Q7S27_02740 [Nanoarchaeota archaeon]|nr:hypothetical protein [Nanoarchaeota archaeon]
MEKDIDRIPKNPETDILIRVDDFGGRRGVTIREFVRSERYTGFTKAGTRIPAEHFKAFKAAINSIDEKELMEAPVDGGQQKFSGSSPPKSQDKALVSDKGAGLDKGKAKAKPKIEDNDIGEGEF